MIENQRFFHIHNRSSVVSIEDLELRNCSFDNCSFSLTDDLDSISRVQNVSLQNTSCHAVQLGPFEARDVVIDGLRTSDLLILWSPFLCRVELRGDIGRFKISAAACSSLHGKPGQKIFDRHRQQFYSDVDWALDISNAKLRHCELNGIPGDLVRRDPETQFLVTRKRLLERLTDGWEQYLSADNKDLPFSLKMFLASDDESRVFAAPMGAKKQKREKALRDLNELRALGFFEPE